MLDILFDFMSYLCNKLMLPIVIDVISDKIKEFIDEKF